MFRTESLASSSSPHFLHFWVFLNRTSMLFSCCGEWKFIFLVRMCFGHPTGAPMPSSTGLRLLEHFTPAHGRRARSKHRCWSHCVHKSLVWLGAQCLSSVVCALPDSLL